MLEVWMTLLTSQPRSASILGAKSGNAVVGMLVQTMQRYLSEVKVSHLTLDKREPEFGFYDQTKGTMTAYRYITCPTKMGFKLRFLKTKFILLVSNLPFLICS